VKSHLDVVAIVPFRLHNAARGVMLHCLKHARRVKKLEQPVNQKPAMMDASHERQSMGSSAGICHGADQSGTASAERVPRCGEPYSPRTPAGTAAPVGSGALHAC